MKVIFTLALTATIFLTIDAFAASVTTYNSRAAFLGALTASTTWDFNGPEGNPVIILNGLGTDIVKISTQGGDAAGVIHDSAVCGSVSGGVDCFRPVDFTLLQPWNAFGFDNLDLTEAEEVVVNVAFANGDPSQQFTFDLGGQPAFSPIFFGVTADQSIASVSVYSRDPGTQTIGERANVVDNVTVGAMVPEAGTLTLLTAASAGVVLQRRRTK